MDSKKGGIVKDSSSVVESRIATLESIIFDELKIIDDSFVAREKLDDKDGGDSLVKQQREELDKKIKEKMVYVDDVKKEVDELRKSKEV